MNTGKLNLIWHMHDELEYFREEQPEQYEEVKEYFDKVKQLLDTI